MNKARILFQLNSQKSSFEESRKNAEMELLKDTVGIKVLADVIETIKKDSDSEKKQFELVDLKECIDQFCTMFHEHSYKCQDCPFHIPQEKRAETLANTKYAETYCMAPMIKANIEHAEATRGTIA